MRLRTILLGGVGVVVAVVAGAAVYVSQMDFNQYRGLIAEQAKSATGRDLAIKGPLKLALGLSPSVDVSDVTFANAPWGSRPEMLKVGRLEAEIELLPLLSRSVKVKRFVLYQADVLVETNAQGQFNFELGGGSTGGRSAPSPAAGGGASAFSIGVNEVEIRDAKIVYRDGTKKGATQTFTLVRATLHADSETAPLKIDVEGALDQTKLQIAGQVGAMAALMQAGGAPFPIDVSGRFGDLVSFKAKGQVKEPAAGKGYDLALSAEGGEIAKLAALGGVRVAALGPFKLDLQVNDQAPGGGPDRKSTRLNSSHT